ncbi:MAG TPA: recombination protein NinB, partial [Holophaga sp.]|nr:recombination protein NinB [Holophaga sp.]
MTKLTFTLAPAPHPARQNAAKAVMEAPEGFVVTIQEPTRNLTQNSRLWASLTEVSRQVDWHGNRLTPDEWKDVFSAALKRQKVVPGIDGGFVVIGARTSKMSKREFGELLELVYAFGAQHGVVFKDPGEEEP